ncbi:adenosine receptor A2b-like [Neocloeon triangulifer]|uniref:adenosine receptor A2b-like n=1 Tax=Neocloeon triangulifer TaxID=2078957 RepID=UPI00286F6B50|nr:adenosine receptor A2b-like [Neocloeon triangulifer]
MDNKSGASLTASPVGDLNDSAAFSLYAATELRISTTLSSYLNSTQSPVSLAPDKVSLQSPLFVSIAIFLVSLFAPLIIGGNALLLGALYRFKRLRTPSNYLVVALSTADVGIGMLLPAHLYLELSRNTPRTLNLCLAPYCVAIALGSASLCSKAAIAADRFTSLAQPLRYNNLVTHTSVKRYVIMIWTYSLSVGFSPLVWQGLHGSVVVSYCSFTRVNQRVQIFILSTVFAPCTLIILMCYCYIYVVARYHARAIFTVELSLRRPSTVPQINTPTNTAIPAATCNQSSRYGQTLALTVGLFLLLWVPFASTMAWDVANDTRLLDQEWLSAGLSLPVFVSSALNPWVYGYHNAEVRVSVHRVWEELLAKFGLGSDSACRNTFITTDVHSYASNARLCAVSPHHLHPQCQVRNLLIPNRDTLECSTLGSAAKETVVHLEVVAPNCRGSKSDI